LDAAVALANLRADLVGEQLFSKSASAPLVVVICPTSRNAIQFAEHATAASVNAIAVTFRCASTSALTPANVSSAGGVRLVSISAEQLACRGLEDVLCLLATNGLVKALLLDAIEVLPVSDNASCQLEGFAAVLRVVATLVKTPRAPTALKKHASSSSEVAEEGEEGDEDASSWSEVDEEGEEGDEDPRTADYAVPVAVVNSHTQDILINRLQLPPDGITTISAGVTELKRHVALRVQHKLLVHLRSSGTIISGDQGHPLFLQITEILLATFKQRLTPHSHPRAVVFCSTCTQCNATHRMLTR
jgi:hypothetical protein